MADIKLFRVDGTVSELPATSVLLERELQTLIEKNMQEFFGVTFLQSEYVITEGRIDSIGIDENYCPVIFEYKRSVNENVINQALFYLDWLLDHKADFKLVVIDKLGMEVANRIDWSVPSVLCIANDFTKYDLHAVNQMQRNIKLIRYKKFGNDLLLFEYLNAPNVQPIKDTTSNETTGSKTGSVKSFVDQLASASPAHKQLYQTIRDYIMSLGDDISENQLKLYVAFKKLRNFATIDMGGRTFYICLRLNPDDFKDRLRENFIKDVRKIAHHGTGDLQIVVRSIEDFEKAKDLIQKAYEVN